MKLTAQERQELIRLEKRMPHKGVSTRIKIILALDEGYAAKDVARILLLDEDTITKWKSAYEQSSTITDWLGTKNTGWQGRLTKKQKTLVEQYVEREIITDCHQVVSYIRNTFDISYTIDGVSKLLHRLNFVYKQVVGIPGNLSEEKQAAFVKEYQQLKASKTETEVILFGDGVHPTHNLHKTKAWIKNGEDKQVRTKDSCQPYCNTVVNVNQDIFCLKRDALIRFAWSIFYLSWGIDG